MNRHFSVEELKHLFSYRATQVEIEAGIAHVISCPSCWDLAAEVVASLRATDDLAPHRRGRPPEQRYRDAREAFLALVEIEERASLGSLRARGWSSELRDLSPREQAEKVKSVAAVQKREVFETLVREAMLVGRRDPFAGEHLAMSAYQLVENLPGLEFTEEVKNGFRLSALTAVANCRRLAGDWTGAYGSIRQASACLAAGKASRGDEAFLSGIHGALACDTGHFEEALRLLRHAASLYQEIGDVEGLSMVAVKEADALLMTGLPKEALKRARHALTFAPSDRLKMLARSIITESLIQLGQISAAVRSYEATQSLYEQMGDELTRLKAELLAALLLDALGHPREAEKLFRDAIEGVTEMEHYRLSFLWRLALVESFVKRSALGKAARLCKDSIALLEQTEGIHAQMSQVWKDLLAAIEAQVLKECHLAVMREYLVRHWTAPAARVPVFAEA